MLWVLESRTAQRTARAAVAVAVSMVGEGIITEREALLRIEPGQMDYTRADGLSCRPQDLSRHVLGRGLAGGGDCLVGRLVFTPQQARAVSRSGGESILAVTRVSSDPQAVRLASGVLSASSVEACSVVRAVGRSVVLGVRGMRVDARNSEVTFQCEAS
eukprot:CAMPEP_0173362454 /NCGR_PEP_ID=MMETSP1144-20121109/21809_1 /TAXON_ID=483371 /ORGANISM="non described non described, Strain CCMP2298" /LENGTH=158 /DNA_ID=CAMNT_0014312235 /DNA_START=347 /DNA_END=820 /DNA_ORIENTATION=+